MIMFLTVIVVFGFIGLWSIVIGSTINATKNAPKPQTEEEKQKAIEDTDGLIRLCLLLGAIIGFIYFLSKL